MLSLAQMLVSQVNHVHTWSQVLHKLELAPAGDETTTGESFDEQLQRLCGVVDVNTFELRCPGGSDSLLRGLFPQAALIAHACRPTARAAVDQSFRMAVQATQPLRPGDIISFNYTSSLMVIPYSRMDEIL